MPYLYMYIKSIIINFNMREKDVKKNLRNVVCN